VLRLFIDEQRVFRALRMIGRPRGFKHVSVPEAAAAVRELDAERGVSAGRTCTLLSEMAGNRQPPLLGARHFAEQVAP
jgi:hypothetical protein